MTSALDTYAASFLDPFDGRITQPKIMDGSVTRSSGLKFRQTGNITLDATGADNWLVLLPGFSSGFYYRSGTSAFNPPLLYTQHLGTTSLRSNLRRVRLVSQGLKLSLLNSSDDNEGYWEAVRIPVADLVIRDATAPIGEDYAVQLPNSFALTNLADYPSFQTGRLRDIHRFLFKLNSVAPDHPFKETIPASANLSLRDAYDEQFDMIAIRIVGRIDAVSPSMLQFDHMSNQEVVYKDDTVMARLATLNTMVPNMDILLDRTRFILPAIQIA